MSNVLKYPRGSLWYVDEDALPKGVHIQAKGRPCVIVSTNDRGASEVAEICVITSSDKSRTCSAINVPVSIEHTQSYIQVNQHFTVNVRSLHHYLGILSPDDILNLNRALLVAQGLSVVCEYSTAINELNDELIQLRSANINSQVADACISYIGHTLKDVVDTIRTMSSVVRKASSTKKISRPRISDDMAIYYMIDFDSVTSGEMSKIDFCKKYNMNTWKSASNRYRYLMKKYDMEVV